MIGSSGLVAVHDKARGLVGAVGVNDAAHLNALFFRAHLQTLIGHDADRPAPDPRISRDERLAVVRLVFIDRIRIDDRGEQIARVVLLLPVEADQVVNCFGIFRRLRQILRRFAFRRSRFRQQSDTRERSRFRQD